MTSQTFQADLDPSQKTYNIHFIAQTDTVGAVEGWEPPTSKALLAAIEATMEDQSLSPVAAQCKTEDGSFTSIVWVDDDPVPFDELLEGYRQSEMLRDYRETGAYGWELYQRTDHRWDWRTLAGNGNIIATSGGQGYENRAEAAWMIYRLFGQVPIAVTPLHSGSLQARFVAEGNIEVFKEEDN